MSNNVTMRKTRHNTFLDISDITTEITEFNSTIADGNLLDISTKSIPIPNEGDTSVIIDLKQQVINLKSEMMIAHEEIENLNIQCSSLKNELADKTAQINILKKISTETVSISPRMSTGVKSPLMRKLTNMRMRVSRSSPINIDNNRDIGVRETPIRKDFNSGLNRTESLKARMAACDPEAKTSIYSEVSSAIHEPAYIAQERSPHDNTNSGTKPKILILGDEQARNLTVQLIKDRNNKWNDKYDVTGLIKPSATSSEILNKCDVATLINGDSDILVLVLGSNDSNPLAMFANLCNFLYRLRGQKVFIVDVQYNRYLNEGKLNSNIKLLTRNYSNCRFIEMTSGNNGMLHHMKPDVFIKKLSFKLNVEIDSLTYNREFLGKNVRKSLCITRQPRSNNSKKGTIPYYFHPIATKPPTVSYRQAEKEPVRGSIPYYFNKMKVEAKHPQNKSFFRA